MTISHLPFTDSAREKTDYLTQVHRIGATYKAESFRLLAPEAGMHVLDVGCGSGLDLSILADLVGPTGRVVGLDPDPDLVAAAEQAIAEDGRATLQVVTGDAHRLPFPDASFDRVRADRSMQHLADPTHALQEIARVLRAGGLLSIVDLDFATVALYPASAAGGNDESAFRLVLQHLTRQVAQPLIGRQLRSLLHRTGWQRVRVEPRSYVLDAWPVADAMLRLSQAAHALADQEPVSANDVRGWLETLQQQPHDFYACLTFFFATAYKGA